jgi:hypothetical protein
MGTILLAVNFTYYTSLQRAGHAETKLVVPSTANNTGGINATLQPSD